MPTPRATVGETPSLLSAMTRMVGVRRAPKFPRTHAPCAVGRVVLRQQTENPAKNETQISVCRGKLDLGVWGSGECEEKP